MLETVRPDRSAAAPRDRCGRGALICAGLLVSVLFVGGCVQSKHTVPRVLQGTWVAEGAGFEGRSMEIGEQRILFRVDGVDTVEHPVLGLSVESKGRESFYALDYATADGAGYRLHLRYDLISGDLRLESRSHVVWRKVETRT